MHTSTWVQKFIFCVLIAVLIAPAAWSQSGTGSVSGTVRDQTGAVIPKASVTLTSKATSVAIQTTANEVGFYLFPNLTPGQFSLAVEAPGMQKFEGSLTVMVQQSAVVDVALKVGQTATAVEVRDVTPLLTVDSPTLGHALERTRIEQLPLNGRAVLTLLQTVPGMEGTRALGLRDFSFEITLDGAPLADRYGWNTMTQRQPGLDSIQEFRVESNNSSAKFPKPTNITMTTKSGGNELHGSAFETNRNNGVGLARTRTDNWTNGKAPPLNRNEFGASAGGPVYIPKVYNGKNKTFWFFSYEALRQISKGTGAFSDPTQAMRDGDFSGLMDNSDNVQLLYNPWTTDPNTWSRQQFSYNGRLNVIDPKLQNPLAKYLTDVMPMPTTTDNPQTTNNWYGPTLSTRKDWSLSTRIDHRFSDKDSFYGRYTKGGYVTLGQFYSQPTLDYSKVPSGTQGYISPNWHMGLSYVHTFSPTLFNELLVSGTRELMYVGTGVNGVKYATELGLPNPFDAWGWPGLYTAGLYNGFYWETQNTNAFNGFYGNLDDNVTKIKGRHEFQFGFHYRYDQMNLLPQQQQVAGNDNWDTRATSLFDPTQGRTSPAQTPFTGDPLGNFYIGVANYSNQFVRGMYYARSKEAAMYFQDNFRATPRLTLNLGVRWDYWPVYTEKHNVVTSFDPTTKSIVMGDDMNTLYTLGMVIPSIVNRLTSLGYKFETWDQAGLPQNLMVSSKKNIGPRLGLAYRVGDGNKAFVVRAGYRISYFHIPLNPWAARMRQNAPMNARFYTSFSQASYSPDGLANLGMRQVPTILAGVNSADAVSKDAAQSLTAGCCGVSYFDRYMPDARVQDWNFTLEKEVMPNTVVRAGYVGNHSSHLEQLYQYNNSTPTYIWYMTTGLPTPTGALSAVATNYFDRTAYGFIERWQNTGWGNSHGVTVEVERRYSKGYGYQLFYVMDNNLAAGGAGYSGTSAIPEVNQFMPGQVPADLASRNKLLNYQRDTGVPHHRVRWNWIVDLPFGKGKPLLGNAGRMLDRLVGGWQLTGMGSLQSRYFSLPTSGAMFPTGVPVQIYDYKYPIQNCTSGNCYPGYLWWNGYIPAYQINSHDPVTGKPNGYEGIPANYKPAVMPIWPYPANYRSLNSTIDPFYSNYGTNNLWVPLTNGAVQKVGWSGLPPLRQQYLPSLRAWSTDASLIKNIAINERFKFRLSGDFFNVFNHPGNPNSVGGTGITSTQSSDTGNASPRTIQLSGRLTW